MALLDTLYVGTLLVSIPLIGAALYYVLDNLGRRGARPLTVLLSGTIVWMSFALLYSVAPSFGVALWSNRLQYLGIVLVPASWVIFALLYSDREHLVNGLTLGVLSVEPIVVVGLVLTNRSHDLWTTAIVPEGETIAGAGGATCDAVICFGTNGPAFVGHALYSYVLLLLGAALVLTRALRTDAIPRGQAASMAVAVSAPLVGNVLSLFVLPDAVPDLTPVTFSVMGVAVVAGLYRYSLVETTALSGAAAIPEQDYPTVLVDESGQVVDLNVGAAAVLGVDADQVVGDSVDAAFENHRELLARFGTGPLEPGGLVVADPISGESYEVNASEIAPEGTPRTGYLYAFSATE